jgi:hypothetical protein
MQGPDARKRQADMHKDDTSAIFSPVQHIQPANQANQRTAGKDAEQEGQDDHANLFATIFGNSLTMTESAGWKIIPSPAAIPCAVSLEPANQILAAIAPPFADSMAALANNAMARILPVSGAHVTPTMHPRADQISRLHEIPNDRRIAPATPDASAITPEVVAVGSAIFVTCPKT